MHKRQIAVSNETFVALSHMSTERPCYSHEDLSIDYPVDMFYM